MLIDESIVLKSWYNQLLFVERSVSLHEEIAEIARQKNVHTKRPLLFNFLTIPMGYYRELTRNVKITLCEHCHWHFDTGFSVRPYGNGIRLSRKYVPHANWVT